MYITASVGVWLTAASLASCKLELVGEGEGGRNQREIPAGGVEECRVRE